MNDLINEQKSNETFIEKSENSNSLPKFKRVEHALTPALCLGAIFILFTLSFFIGLTEIIITKTNSSFTSSGETSIQIAQDNVFYFLGNSFKDIQELFEGVKYKTNYESFMVNVNVIYGICMALVIINFAVQFIGLILGAFALVEAIRTGNRKPLNILSALSFVSFLTLSLTLYGVNYNQVAQSNHVSSIILSGSSVFGIVLSVILLVCSIILTAVANGKAFFNQEKCKKFICVSLIVVFAFMALSFNNSEYLLISDAFANSKTSVSALLYFITLNSAGFTMSNIEDIQPNLTFSNITIYSHILTTVALALLLVLAVYIVLNGDKAKNKLFLISSISVAVLAVFNLVISIITIIQPLPTGATILGDLTLGSGVIVSTALSLIVLALSIVFVCAKDKQKKIEEN